MRLLSLDVIIWCSGEKKIHFTATPVVITRALTVKVRPSTAIEEAVLQIEAVPESIQYS